jgi:hypothetical protein
MNAEATMDTNLRLGSAVVLLAMCGCASIEPAQPVSAHRDDTGAVQLSEPAGGSRLVEAPIADPSGIRFGTELAEFTESTAAALAGSAADAAGESRTVSGRRLTPRQKRIFVLGLAAQEKK